MVVVNINAALNRGNNMQVQQFSNGGYVIHRITHQGQAKISAWFDRDGNLLDIEKFDKNGRKTGQGIVYAMERCRVIGRIHNPNTRV